MSDARRRRRFGLHAKVIVAFAVGAALVSAVLAVSTFYFVRRALVDQQVRSVLRQTYADARLVKLELGAPSAQIGDALASVAPADGALAYIDHDGTWYSSSASVTGTTIPEAFTRAVVDGATADQRVALDGVPTLVVGVPIPSLGIQYFEEHPLAELASTLRVLVTVLTTVAIATTVGGALVGWWASRRLVRPLNEVVMAATEIAGGTLDRRVPADPDLQPLVESFNLMVGALQERIERDARFAADVTHELRSPITTIGASIELLGSHVEALPADAAMAVRTLRFEVTRFARMVQDLLEIAGMDAGAASVHFTELPLATLVRATASGRRPPVPVGLGPGTEDVVVRGDKLRLHQVLVNLLDNADTYGGGAVAIEIERHGPWVEVSVDDAGPGVPVEERARIFERFYRGAASGRRSGTTGSGLGLALVAEHVRLHGGSVRVGERPGGGARMTVVLPVAEPSATGGAP